MKILIFSEMFPKPNAPSSGIFVKKRLEYLLKEKRMDFDFAPISTFDTSLISFVKRLKKIPRIELTDFLEVEHKKFKVFQVPLKTVTRYEMIKGKTKAWIKYAEEMMKTLEQNFKVSDYNLIHAHRAFPEGHAAFLLSEKYKIPYIVTSHGSEIHSAENDFLKLIIDILENSSKAIFVSEYLRKDAIKKGYSGRKSVVIPNGIDTDIFKPVDKTKARKKLNIYQKDYKYVGFVGNLIPIKRADKLPEIFHDISRSIPNIHFIVVGDGYLKRDIEKRTKDLQITFTGRIKPERVPIYMNAMDVMILPSRNEGWPCVVLEAQACGVPVVGSSNGGIPEAIGDNDMIVTEGPNFENRFAKRVIYVLKNSVSPNKLRRRAVKFSWKSMVRREIEIYCEVANFRF
ncbi:MULTISPECIES: glycosyltransferase [Kosmotoga]|nr:MULTISPECIES: glycosyltransferase [Kosmotoga]ACR80322.1 glycosyl transferase group 1 [Kosmotoga olearia TBF 19.5.1]OAA20253.1 glycosyl transferase group 1 [Kosmotoga sp. DU53]